MSAERRAAPSGYSLIEVLIALAILSSALTILMGTMANSSQQAVFATQLTQASLLARAKMTDLEYEIMSDGFSTSDRRLSGNFSAEGYPDIRWEALIEPVEIPAEAQEAFLGQINAQLFGGADAQAGALQGNVAFSSMLPMLMAQLPTMINQIGDKVRRVTLTVSFEFAGRTQPLEIMQYVVDLESRDFNMFSMPDDFGAGEP
jgi:general secretion pathway protein I